jgi:hypothetical protein
MDILAYNIAYHPPAVDCTLTQILADTLGVASLSGDAAPIFGTLGSGVGIVAQLDGC